MTKPFLRSVLAGFAAAGFATAQTPPPPTSTPPLPAGVQQIAFKVVPAPAKPAEKLAAKVLDVVDLVSPPAGSPLAKPGDDTAMKAAARAYTEARAEQLMTTIRSTVERNSWDDAGGPGTLDFYEAGTSLVVRNNPAAVARVVECVETMRKLRDTHVLVEMRLLSMPSRNEAVKKLLDGKQHAPLSAADLKELLDSQVEMLSQPKLMLLNKQTGFCQVGQQQPIAAPAGVSLVHVGITTRATPEVSADMKSVRLKMDVEMTELNRTSVDLGNGQKACGIDSQQIETTLNVPDGGSMAVMVGTKKVERRIESKVPMMGDLPYLGRLFRSVGVSMESTDTVAVVTVRLIDAKATPAAGPMPTRVAPVAMPVPPMMPALAPLPLASMVPPPPAPPSAPIRAVGGEVRLVARPGTAGQHVDPLAPAVVRTVGPDGLERVGVDFNAKPTAALILAPVADPLMTAYKAACAAGRKDEAARLALQLLAKDPTCFGRDR